MGLLLGPYVLGVYDGMILLLDFFFEVIFDFGPFDFWPLPFDLLPFGDFIPFGDFFV
jgi:hypothetical protein